MTPLEIRQEILRIAKLSGHGHIPTCFSVVEIMVAVYDTIRHRPNEPGWNARDIFILSKGHASLAHYCVLAANGYFPLSRLDEFGAFESDFGCHADRLKIPGIEASTGSLGHGIGLAIGNALAIKIKGEDRRVYTLVGDGESNEGTVWESLMVASNLSLDNLTVIYDDNRSHARGLQITNPAEKLKAFGCDTVEVDGHDIEGLKEALSGRSQKPGAIVASTEKGRGSRTMIANHYEWHRKSPDEDEYAKLMDELNA